MPSNIDAGSDEAIPEINFAEARGARIAWQRFGSGPTVMAIPPTAQNIEAAWGWPRVRAMFDRFGSFCTWVQFDKRGSGASDRRSANPGIDERVEDLRAVMDAAGVDKAFLCGASEGGPTCLLFAATYPERVQGLILHGTGPYTAPQDVHGDELVKLQASHKAFASIFGTSESPMVDWFAPSIAHEEGYRDWHMRYERVAATQDSLLEMLEISLSVDVSEILHEIDAPTLVLHATNDQIVPVAWGRILAREIENAELHEYDSNDHFAYADLGWVDAMERFVTGRVASQPALRAARRNTHIETLGRFRVIVDDVEVPNSAWGSRRSRQLCKRLVAARGWPIRRQELIAQLWPDENDESKLGARLSVQLSAVRRVLGGGVIADRQTVALNLDEVTTDLEALMRADEPADLLSLFEGDFLPGDVDEAWASGIRDAARARFTGAAHERLTENRQGDEHLARKILRLDRWDERAHTALIRLLASAGLQGDARRAHQTYTTAMAELDIEVNSFESCVTR